MADFPWDRCVMRAARWRVRFYRTEHWDLFTFHGPSWHRDRNPQTWYDFGAHVGPFAIRVSRALLREKEEK